MIAPNNVVLSTDPHRSVVEALVKNVAQNGPNGAPLTNVARIPPKIPNFNANKNCETNSPPYGYGGRNADKTVLPVRIIMSPTSSSKFFVGRNARSATLRTISILPHHSGGGPAIGHRREAYANRRRNAKG